MERMRRSVRRVAWFFPALALAAAVAMHAARPQQPPAAPDAGAPHGDGATPSPPEGGGEEEEQPQGERPERVTIGLFLDHVPVIDLHSNTYIADFYIWFRWKGDIDPTASYE